MIGGASNEETDSGLFVYSSIPFINIQMKNNYATSDDCNDDYYRNNDMSRNNSDNYNITDNRNSSNISDYDSDNNYTNHYRTYNIHGSEDDDDNDYNNVKRKRQSGDKTIFKESWDYDKKKFEWKRNEALISNPRMISQVSACVCVLGNMKVSLIILFFLCLYNFHNLSATKIKKDLNS